MNLKRTMIALVVAGAVTASSLATAGVAQAADLTSSFAAVQSAVGVPVGLAIAPANGAADVVLGNDPGTVAWSTSKVPVAIAAEQQFGSAVSADVSAAITESDNAAAQRLWDRLGSGQQAATATQNVIRAGGDGATVVNPTVSRAGYTAFGQTQWTYANQATFAAHLTCMAAAAPVLALMRNVASDQQWGVQSITGAAVKGGWGPTTDGRYYVRQMAVINTNAGQVGLAMGTVAATFAAGQAVLNKVGAWVGQNIPNLTYGHC
ncbi:hypothetical protein [Tsukamurella soli]|uniref:Secreted protein n=1 Tax=Tsukamurella soli TaxID=644556 RepID=A0ABP8K5Q5_9ACTN